jgi:predicted ester cyclase
MSQRTMPTPEILAARERLVLDHFNDEVLQQWDDVLATFPHPHYEIIATMTVHDGNKEVRGYYHDTRVAFPDQDHELISLRHSHDAVIAEFWLLGTHLGPLGAIPPTGSRFRVRMTAFFIFDENENLIIERIYFDTLTMLKQLLGGAGLKNPKNWLLAIKALRGLLKMSGEPDRRLLATIPPDLEH